MVTPKTYYAIQSEDATFNNVAVENLTVNGNTVAGGVLVGTDEVVDLNGQKLVIDADTDTYIQQTGGAAGTDDSFDIVVAGAADFRVTANTLTALSGSSFVGNLTGNVTGNVTGNITGNVTGNVAGTLSGGQKDAPVAITGDGAITVAPSSIFLSKAGAAAITIVAPTVTTHDGYIIRVVAISAQAHVITSAVVGFNAKGSSGTLTFGGAIGDSVTLIAYQGNWYVIATRNVTPA